MVSPLKEGGRLESVCWFAGGAALAGLGIWIYNRYFGGFADLENWKTSLEKELAIDRIKINKTLSLGTQAVCPIHNKETPEAETHVMCEDPDCRFSALGYLVKTLSSAQHSLDVAIFSFTSHFLGNAFLEAHHRGVRVRVVADAEVSMGKDYPLGILAASGVLIRQRVCTPFHMHHKFIIVDEDIVVNGSMNFTDTGLNGNWENVVISSEPGIVRPFVNEFQALWEDFDQGKELILNDIPAHARRDFRRYLPVAQRP